MAEPDRAAMTGLPGLARQVLAAGGTVVTANRRLAQAIANTFNAAALQAAGPGRSWPSPDVLPWDAWVRREWMRLRDSGGSALRRVVLNPVQSDRLWQRVLDTAGERPVDLPGAAREARRARALLFGWELDPAATLGGVGDDPQGFRRLHAAFETRLAARRWTDQPGMERELADGARAPETPIAFAGFDAWTPLQTRIADRVGGTMLTAPRGAPARIIAAPFPEPDAEISAAAGWMKARTAENPGTRLALVVPDLAGIRDRVEALLSGVLSPGPAWDLPPAARRPWNLTIGRPLSEWGLAHAALEALRGLSAPMPFGRASRLLRSPWLGATAAEASSRARVEAGLRRAGWFELSAGQLAGAAGRGGCPVFAAGFETAIRRLSGDPGSRRLTDWAGEFGQILRDLGWPGADALDSETFQLFQAWGETLESFAALDAVSGPVDFRRAVGELSLLAGERVFQPESADAPVQVLGLLEAAGQPFDAVWISGLHDQVWPPPLKPNAFLPVRLQRDLGMPRACPERELNLARERLDGMLHAAPEVVLSWPETAGDEVLRPSPLIARWVAEGPRVEVAQPETWGARLAAARSREPLPADQLDRVSGRRSGGMAVLSDQSRCPFRAAAVHRLAAEPLESPLPGVDPRVRGSWAHAALRRLWTDWAGREAAAALDDEDRARQIEAAVTAARKETGVDDGPVDPGHAELEAVRLTALIRKLVEEDLTRPDFRVLATEASVELTLGGLVLSGRLDRLDRDALGDWIIDYKTGDARVRGWLAPRLPDPQVPAYAAGREALAGVAFGIVQSGKTGYQGLVRGDQPVGPFKPVEGMRDAPAPGMDWADLKAWWGGQVEALAREFASGRADVAPRDGNACRYCGLDMLCRRHELEVLPGGSGGGDD